MAVYAAGVEVWGSHDPVSWVESSLVTSDVLDSIAYGGYEHLAVRSDDDLRMAFSIDFVFDAEVDFELIYGVGHTAGLMDAHERVCLLPRLCEDEEE